jgi:hypothetical protein
MTRAAAWALVCAAAAAPGATAGSWFESVVMVRCALAGGEAKATGFVWPEPGRVVTALHGVAGCEEIVVWSEATGRETLGWIERVDLESDLALLALDDDLGLAPVSFAPEGPDTTAEHVTMGYPLAAEQMIRLDVEFGGGLRGDVTTLGAAFASDELETLFRDQPYPTRDTSILRVNSTIQPGHSGAPIFDATGAVVAIVDGGLLGGWRTINWSIPAHLYLPGLLASEDPPPDGPSHQAQLFSSMVPRDPATVAMTTPAAASDAATGEAPAEIALVRQFGLADLEELLIAHDDADGLALIEEFRSYLEDPAEEYGFDIYEEPTTGATIGVPMGVELYWNEHLGALEAVNPRGTAFMNAVVLRTASFQEAVEVAAREFVGRFDGLAAWYDGVTPLTHLAFDDFDPEAEYAGGFAVFAGEDADTGVDAEMPIGIYASGPDFLGTAAYAVWSEEEFELTDRMDYIMMQLAVQYLTDFALN